MKTILVPLDLSRESVRVCNAACELARSAGAKVVLLHVEQPVPIVMSDIQALDVNVAQAAEVSLAAEKIARSSMQKFVRHCAKRKVKTTIAQRIGAPVGAILTQAKASRASYIVMGSHGHGAVYELLAGSTTHGVLKKATCPVLIVPSLRSRAKKQGSVRG